MSNKKTTEELIVEIKQEYEKSKRVSERMIKNVDILHPIVLRRMLRHYRSFNRELILYDINKQSL